MIYVNNAQQSTSTTVNFRRQGSSTAPMLDSNNAQRYASVTMLDVNDGCLNVNGSQGCSASTTFRYRFSTRCCRLLSKKNVTLLSSWSVLSLLCVARSEHAYLVTAMTTDVRKLSTPLCNLVVTARLKLRLRGNLYVVSTAAERRANSLNCAVGLFSTRGLVYPATSTNHACSEYMANMSSTSCSRTCHVCT